MTEAFRLEVDGWESDAAPEDAAPESGPAKRRKLSLSLKRKDSGSSERLVFLDNAETLNKRYVPKNTERNTQWALTTFRSWRDKHNEHFREEPDKQVPAHLQASSDKATIR